MLSFFLKCSNIFIIIAVTLPLFLAILLRKSEKLIENKSAIIRFIAKPKTISNIMFFIVVLSFIGVIGNQYFGKKVEEISPYRQSINSAEATISLDVNKKVKGSINNIGGWCYVLFMEGQDTILTLLNWDSYEYSRPNNSTEFRAELYMEMDDHASGKPVNTLAKADQIKIYAKVVPKNRKLLGGKAMFIINNDIRFEADIPQDTEFKSNQGNNNPDDKYILITDLKEVFKNFK